MILTLTLGGTACQKQQEDAEQKKARYAAEQAAYAYLESFAKATPENEAAWGLTSFSIYGQPAIANPAGSVEHISQPGGYRLVIPLWVQGKDAQGEHVRLIRKLSLEAKLAGENSWTASNPQFLSDEPLTFRRLFWTWTLRGLGAVAIFVVMSLCICWIATRERVQPTRSSGPATPPEDLAGCGNLLVTLFYLIVPVWCVVEANADPSFRMWGVCIWLFWLACVPCPNTGKSNKWGEIVGVLALGFPVMYGVKGLYDSTLLAAALFLGPLFATVFVCAAVKKYRDVRQSFPTQLGESFPTQIGEPQVGEPDLAELLASLRKQQRHL